jgi:hypothetical protein
VTASAVTLRHDLAGLGTAAVEAVDGGCDGLPGLILGVLADGGQVERTWR